MEIKKKSRMAISPLLINSFIMAAVAVGLHLCFGPLTPKYYLLFCTLVAGFRAAMYFIKTRFVTIEKIDPEYHDNALVMEPMGRFIGTIRLLMITKTVIFGWGVLQLGSVHQFQLSIISFLLDCHISYSLLRWMDHSKSKIFRHNRGAIIPNTLQMSLIIAGVWMLLAHML